MLPIESVRRFIRLSMRYVAVCLNKLFNGKIKPNTITYICLGAHVPIAIFIATGHYAMAAILLVIFGLFDVLDGELARLQKSSTAAGMLLDASSDRIKETLVFTAIAYTLATKGHILGAAIATAACGASLSVSYVKAKGEVAFASNHDIKSHEKLNLMFKNGYMPFELRVVMIELGLIDNQLLVVTIIILVLASLTVFQRLLTITGKLKYAED